MKYIYIYIYVCVCVCVCVCLCVSVCVCVLNALSEYLKRPHKSEALNNNMEEKNWKSQTEMSYVDSLEKKRRKEGETCVLACLLDALLIEIYRS